MSRTQARKPNQFAELGSKVRKGMKDAPSPPPDPDHRYQSTGAQASAYQAQRPGQHALIDQFKKLGEQEGYRRHKQEMDAARDVVTEQILAAVAAKPEAPPPPLSVRWERPIVWGASIAFSLVAWFWIIRVLWALCPMLWDEFTVAMNWVLSIQ